jgi:hypothetical protein
MTSVAELLLEDVKRSMSLHSYQDAIQVADEVLRLDPNLREAVLCWVLTAEMIVDSKTLDQEVERLSGLLCGTAEGYVLAGLLAGYLGSETCPFDHYSIAIWKDPNCMLAYYLRGNWLFVASSFSIIWFSVRLMQAYKECYVIERTRKWVKNAFMFSFQDRYPLFYCKQFKGLARKWALYWRESFLEQGLDVNVVLVVGPQSPASPYLRQYTPLAVPY